MTTTIAAPAPSVLVFAGALFVLLGVAVVMLSLLMRERERTVSAVGNCVIGGGSALSFVGLAKPLTEVESILLYVALGVLAIILVSVVVWRPNAHADGHSKDK
jgi:hypothetical protein